MWIINDLKRRLFSSKSGSILIAALIVTTALALVMGAHSSRLFSEYRMADRSYHMSAALNLAEAGIQHAMSELNYGNGSYTGWTASDGGSTQSITVSALTSTSGNVCGGYTVTMSNIDTDDPVVVSVGRSPSVANPRSSKSVKVALKRSQTGFFTMAVFGKESVLLNSNAQIDSYNSADGEYGGANVSCGGNVGTNSTSESWPYAITMNSNAVINGSAIVGVGGNANNAILENANVTITGNKTELDEPKTFPAVYGPVGLTYKGSLTLNSNANESITESGKYDNISLNSNSYLTVSGDVQIYVTGTLSLNSNTHIDIQSGGSLELYVDGNMNFNSNAYISNVAKDPTKCILYGTSNYTGNLNFNSNTAFYGVVYAPEANIQMNSNSGIYGSVVGKSVSINSNGKVHYDEALGESSVGPATGDYNYQLTSWAEVAPQ